jgi:Mrp family chromosome partitioning ATPase
MNKEPSMRQETYIGLQKLALSVAVSVRQGRMPSIVFTSPASRQGTTTVTLQIACQLLACFGLRPLVIELNIDRPRLCRDFRLDSARTIQAVASGELSIAEAVQMSPANVALLPSDPANGTVPAHLADAALDGILSACQNQFDIVMIDAPPILDHVTTMMASLLTRHVMLVVAAGTPYDVLMRIKAEIDRQDVTLVGTILNKQRRIVPRWLDHLH